MTNAESFRALLQSDAALSAKFEEIAASYVEEASAAGITTGITIRADDLCEIAAIRLHAMAGEPSGDWLAEAHAKLRGPKRSALRSKLFSMPSMNATTKRLSASPHLNQISASPMPVR